MRVAITGASGLVGSALTQLLENEGHDVLRLIRRAASGGEISWQPHKQIIEAEKLEGIDAVVHLAGENVAEGRWNSAKKQRIHISRTEGTQLIANTLAQLDKKPRVFVSASAIGFYGDQRAEPVDEESGRGQGFLADVCTAWEEACQPVREAGIRTVNVRIGVVLSKDGGALAKMLTPFRLCAGGVIGSGKQVWSWVAIHDVVGAIKHALETESVAGPLNATAPNAVTNAEFTRALGHVLGRPTLIPMPAFLAKLALGEMAEALLLSSSRVLPRKLQDTGYKFQHEDLEPTLRALLK